MATMTQTPPTALNGSAHPFTCNTCQVAFRSSDLQRTHMQSDWHRYNLKRRVASLPPLASEVFAEKVLANKASAAATAARASFEKRCETCDKTYFSEGAFVNHLGSQKHRMLAARSGARGRGIDGAETDSMADSTFTLGETLDTASTAASTISGKDAVSEDEHEMEQVVQGLRKAGLEEATSSVQRKHAEDQNMDDDEYEHKADLSQCLFCNYASPTMELNLNHMSRQHSFFIPEKDYLVDLSGLINYLSESVNVLHQCLFCHKQVHTTPGVQTHMRDRGHCMIAYSTEDEQMDVGEFYDFRSTYSDEESETEEEEAPGGVRLGAKRAVKTTIENGAGEDVDMDADEDGWESDGSLSSVPTDEITSVPVDQSHKYERLGLHRHHSRTDPRPHKNTDGFHSHAHHGTHAAYHDDYELHLPSGRTAGHRSLKQYYKQNLRNYPSAEERAEQRMIEEDRHDSDADDEDAESQAIEQNGGGRGRQLVSRANGGLGMIGVSDDKKREVKAVEKREKKRAQRAEARYEWAKNKKANSQKHFRDHLLQ